MVAVARALVELHAVEKSLDAADRGRGDFQMGHLPALQAHQLPAGDGRVAGHAGKITPAAAAEVLGVDDEADRSLGKVFERLVLGHSIGFAQGERGDSVGVHRAVVAQVDAMRRDLGAGFQIIDALFDHVLVFALAMRVAGAEEGQQRQAGGGGGAGLAAGVAAHAVAGGLFEIEAPTAVFALVGDEPLQAAFDGGFALAAAAAAGGQAGAGGGISAFPAAAGAPATPFRDRSADRLRL